MNLSLLLHGGAGGGHSMHSSLPVGRQETVCGTQEHKEEVVRFWYGPH